MKTNYILILLGVLCITFSLKAQDHTPQKLSNQITAHTTLKKNTTYLYTGDVLISNQSILTIEEGVTFKSETDKHLTFIIEGGSKVIASGSQIAPITINANMTSDKKPTIMVKSASQDTMSISVFNYEKIEHPTVILNPNKISKTSISSTMDDF